MKNIIIYLTTPLLSDPENDIPQGTYKLKGTLESPPDAGANITVTHWGTDDGWQDANDRQCFIPAHKMDFLEWISS